MFWPAGNFLLTASQDNCCRLHCTWYLMQIIDYLVLTCTWPFEIQKYLVLTCTWRLKYLILVQVLKYFCQYNKYSVLNLWICSLQQFTTEHHNQNYWNGSYWVCWQHGSQDVKTGLSPWFTSKDLMTQYGDKILVITGLGSGLSPVWCKPLEPTSNIINWTLLTVSFDLQAQKIT